jgi:hypothetical protein
MVDGYGKALKSILKRHGCYRLRTGKGDHEVWFNPGTNRQFVVDNGTRSRFTAQATLKQAGIDERI